MRIAIAILGVLFVVAWIALAALGSGFRRSFGASPVDALTVLGLPAAVAFLVALLFATARPWLHAGALVAVVAALAAAWLALDAPFAGGCALAWLAAWLIWYRGAAWT